MTTTNKLSDFEDATTARWLTATLAPAKRRTKEGPTTEAVDRIRARVFGDAAETRTRRSIAA